jgi:hypothetical protein
MKTLTLDSLRLVGMRFLCALGVATTGCVVLV